MSALRGFAPLRRASLLRGFAPTTCSVRATTVAQGRLSHRDGEQRYVDLGVGERTVAALQVERRVLGRVVEAHVGMRDHRNVTAAPSHVGLHASTEPTSDSD